MVNTVVYAVESSLVETAIAELQTILEQCPELSEEIVNFASDPKGMGFIIFECTSEFTGDGKRIIRGKPNERLEHFLAGLREKRMART